MSRPLAALLLGVLAAAVLAACGSVRRPGEPTASPGAGTATVRGHLSWPDCSGAACPPVGDVPVHFADASANRTFTAVSDGSGGYAIQLPAGTYVVIAGHADRSPYQRQLTVRPGDVITLNLPISPPTGLAARQRVREWAALVAVAGLAAGWASGGGPAP